MRKCDFHLNDIRKKNVGQATSARRQIVPRDDESSSRVLSFSPCRVAPLDLIVGSNSAETGGEKKAADDDAKEETP